jgi:exodeoxyribonuclease V gamma subunit
VGRALGERSGVGRWSTGPLTWAVHAVLQEVGADLGQATDAVRARAIADLFDRYTLYRPEMVRGWSDGRDVDGTGAPLEAHHRWQPALWRAVQEHLGGGPTDAQLVDELTRALEAGDASRLPPELPERLSLFGLASLPPAHLRLVTALASHLDVHVLAPTASAARWARAAEALTEPLRLPVRRGTDEEEALAVGGGHPLVSSWGRDAREAHVLLLDRARQLADRTIEPPGPVAELPDRPTLLQRLQHAVRADERPPGPQTGDGRDRLPVFDPADDLSVRWHRAYGPARQVEVLRDALLHLFEETDADGSPRFEPRDVAVLCPDVAAFAPLLEATFAGDAEHGVPAVPVRVADRSLRQDNPVLDAAAALLDLLDGRFRASAVLAFAARAPVRHRFGFDGAGLSRLSEWAEATNVRWGLGPDDHVRFGLPADLDVHTWRAGLDQLLVGSAMAPSEPRLGPGDVAPFTAVEGDDVALLGALAELIDQLEQAGAALRSAATVVAWCDALAAALQALCAVPDADAWQWRAVERTLAELRDEASVDGEPRTTPVDPADLAVLVRGRLSAAGGRARFGTGAVTVSSLTAQRGVPHRVVCLLGIDTDAAAGGLAAEDLAAARPCVGDRDPRGEQRAQLLDAVLAAEDRLWVLSTGHDVRTNVEVSPVVALAELLDVVDATVRPPVAADPDRRRPARELLTVDHPRQAWSEPTLTEGGLGPGAPATWSFDEGALRAAEARRRQQLVPVELLREPLPPPAAPARGVAGPADPGGVEEVALGQLVDAVVNPARLLLRDRLGLTLPDEDDARDDAIPLEIGGLEEWKVVNRLLEVHLTTDGDDVEQAEAIWESVERRRGAVPPLRFGDDTLAASRSRVAAYDDALRQVLGSTPHDPTTVPVDVTVPGPHGAPVRVHGMVEGVCGHQVITVTPSRFKPKDRLTAWVRVAALTAQDPSRCWEAVTIARADKDKDKALVERVQLLDPGSAPEVLALVDDLRRRALCDVVPAFPATTHGLWCKGTSGARSAWDAPFGGEGGDRWVVAAIGDDDLDTVLALPLRPGEVGGSGVHGAGAGTRLGHWAERIWGAFEVTTGRTLQEVDADPDEVGPDHVGRARAGAR